MPNGMPPPPPPMPRSSRTLSLRRKSFQRMVELLRALLQPAYRNARPLRNAARMDVKVAAPGVILMQLVEQYAGVGSLRWRNGTVGPVPYQIARYQGMATSGLPVPGVHR